MKLKKVFVFIVEILVAVLIFFLISKLFMRGYKVDYKVNDLFVKEEYVYKDKYYKFTINYKEKDYIIVKESERIRNKKLIDNILIYEEPNLSEQCILLESKKFENYPVCYKDDNLVDFSYIEGDTSRFYKRDNVRILKKEYKNIKVNTILDKNVLVWANKGYYFINETEEKEIMFLNKEFYYNNLAYKVGEFLITPDYDQEYTFDKFYIINMKNGKIDTWELEYKISYNSYYLGNKEGIIYMFDRKEKCEYAINPEKKKIEIVSNNNEGQVWFYEWEDVSLTKLASSDYHFEFDTAFKYNGTKDGLVLNLENDKDTLLSNKKIDIIVETKGEEVFYLSGKKLYMYSLKYGEVELLENREWEFNNKNSVYIY